MTKSKSKSSVEVTIPVERQKAAQAAGNFSLEDMPGPLGEPVAAVRVGKAPQKDTPLKETRGITDVTTLRPGEIVVNFGRSESRWVSEYSKRRAGTASFMELLSYARQIVGLNEDGQTLVCLMGHAGQGPCIPLWVPQEEEISLTVQPNDVVMRFQDISFDW